MKEKVHIIILNLLIVSFLVFVGCPVSASPSVTLKISSPFPAFDQRTRTLQFWADTIEHRTEGRVKGKVFPGASLSPIQDADLVTSQRIVDVAFFGSMYVANRYPIFKVFEFPGAYSAKPEVMPIIDRAIRPTISKTLAAGNIQYLFWSYEGEVSTNLLKRPILKLEDWKDLRIRVPGKTLGEVLRGFGAKPVAIPTGEIPMALQRGTVDGAFVAWPIDLAFKLYEVAPHITIYPAITLWAFAGMNLEVFKSLSAADQQILMDAGREASLWGGVVGLELRDLYHRRLREAKITANFLSEDQLKLFFARTNEVINEFKKEATPEQLELLKIIEQHK
jgi:TRAP-type C4-dicarboxylate transport system substrate-binding protein